MLKRIRVILYVVIIIIGICEKVSSESIDIMAQDTVLPVTITVDKSNGTLARADGDTGNTWCSVWTIIIIGICEKVSSESIDIGCGHIWRRKSEPLWMLHLIHLLRIIIKSFAKFITQIGVRILITDYLDRRINPHGWT